MSKMNYDKLFWDLINKSGKNAYKINKIRKEAKQQYGKKDINEIDSIFSSYYSKIYAKFESLLGQSFDEDDDGVRDFIFYILSKGKTAVNQFLNTKNTDEEFKDMGKLTVLIQKMKQLFYKKSKYQLVEVFKTKEFGNVLSIDNDINVTQLDEKNYHEMIVHVPMAYKPNAKRVLVIGGGDGGTAREFLRYPNLDVTMVEIDKVVIEAATKFLPETAASFKNPRLKLLIEDGSKFIENYKGPKFDVVAVDSTDFNQAVVLFTNKFYKNIKKNLTKDGIFVFNNDSVYNDKLKLITRPVKKMSKIYNHVYPYQLFIPTYNGGHYTMMFCSDTIHPIKSPIQTTQWCNLNFDTDYYNIGVHLGSFFLPNNLSKKLNDKLNICKLPTNKNSLQNNLQRGGSLKPPKMCYQSIVNLYDVQHDVIDKPNILMPILREIAKKINLTILKECYHKFEPQGMTACLLLSESHISIHTWPERGSAALDILSCGNNPANYIEEIVKLFNTTNYTNNNFTR